NQVIPGLGRDNCVPVRGDSTRAAVTWKGADLAKLAGQAVRYRFHLRNGELYAFWVSPTDAGASHGYVAAGGPGFTGPTDSVGQGAGGMIPMGRGRRTPRPTLVGNPRMAVRGLCCLSGRIFKTNPDSCPKPAYRLVSGVVSIPQQAASEI